MGSERHLLEKQRVPFLAFQREVLKCQIQFKTRLVRHTYVSILRCIVFSGEVKKKVTGSNTFSANETQIKEIIEVSASFSNNERPDLYNHVGTITQKTLCLQNIWVLK